jgi:site-specific DNA recombinase
MRLKAQTPVHRLPSPVHRVHVHSRRQKIFAIDRSHDEMGELAVKVFELSHTLRHKWLTANYAEKRRILEIVWLNCTLNGTTLCPTMRKPFDVLAEGLVSKESGGGGN